MVPSMRQKKTLKKPTNNIIRLPTLEKYCHEVHLLHTMAFVFFPSCILCLNKGIRGQEGE